MDVALIFAILRTLMGLFCPLPSLVCPSGRFGSFVGQNVILEAFNGDQTLSMILDPLGSRIRSAYTLISSSRCSCDAISDAG